MWVYLKIYNLPRSSHRLIISFPIGNIIFGIPHLDGWVQQVTYITLGIPLPHWWVPNGQMVRHDKPWCFDLYILSRCCNPMTAWSSEFTVLLFGFIWHILLETAGSQKRRGNKITTPKTLWLNEKQPVYKINIIHFEQITMIVNARPKSGSFMNPTAWQPPTCFPLLRRRLGAKKTTCFLFWSNIFPQRRSWNG